jgi:ABC-type transporter Mla MlaB component
LTDRGNSSGDGLRKHPVLGVEEVGTAVVVRLGGELDLYNAAQVGMALADACAQAPERLVVDLEKVEFIDSTALGVLIETRTKLDNRAASSSQRPASRRGVRSRSPGSTSSSPCTTPCRRRWSRRSSCYSAAAGAGACDISSPRINMIAAMNARTPNTARPQKAQL